MPTLPVRLSSRCRVFVVIGLSTLRSRFVVTALALVAVLCGIGFYAQNLVSGRATAALRTMEDHEALRKQLDSLQPPLRDTERLIYRYAINLDPRLSRQVIAQLQRVRVRAAAVAGNPLTQQSDHLRQTVLEFVGVLQELERQVRSLLAIIGDAHRRFPAMDLLTNGMFPINEEYFAAIGIALEEARGLRDQQPRQWEIYELLESLRYTWLQQTSTFRLYVADRSGVFGDPDEASEIARKNLGTYAGYLGELLTRMEVMDEQDLLGFQQSGVLPEMRDAWTRWNNYARQATIVYASDRWRADLPALRQSVSPLLARAWELNSSLQAQLDAQTRDNIRQTTATSHTLSRFVWSFIGIIVSVLGIGWILFERLIRRPLHNVARAMKAEARDGSAVPLDRSGIAETDTLISAFQLMQGQVRSRQLRIKAILDNAGDGIITIDEHGRIETFNQAAQEMFGIEPEAAVGQNVSILMPEPYAGHHDGYLKRYLDGGVSGAIGQIRKVTGLRDDGSVFPLDLKVSELQLDDRRLFIGMVRDISDRKEADEALHRAKEMAEEASDEAQRKASQLATSLHDLQRAQAQLVESEKMASLGGLVAGIAHEINTPVGIGVTAASSLQERVADIKKRFDEGSMKRSDLERFLAGAAEGSTMVLSNLHRAAELVQSFKQVAVDQTSDKRRRFLLGDYLNEILLSLRPRLKKTSHEITVDCPDDLELDSYPGSLSQVITNLVTNSLIHAYDEGETGHIQIKAAIQGRRLHLVYRDDGKGIPESDRQKIFEPFFTTRRGKGGSGLGMHVVYNIVKQHLKGDIRCDSELGKGATFTIDIPYHP